MSTGELTKGKSRLRALAKQVLDQSEYALLRNAWTSFTRTKSVRTLCSEIIGILNCPEKVGLLAEVKLLLPEHMHSEFLQQCRYYQSMAFKQKPNGVPHNSKGAQKYKQIKQNGAKRKLGVVKEIETENRAPNQQASPLKMAKVKHKTMSSRPKADDINGKVSQRKTSSSKTADKRSKPIVGNTAEGKSSEPKVKKGDYRSLTLERSRDQDFGFRLLSPNTAGMVVNKVFSNSPADKQGICVGDTIIYVNGLSSSRMPKEEIIKLIRTAKTLHLKLLPARNTNFKVGRDQASCVTMVSDEASCVKEVTVYADGSGWLGCSIRGGSDYACDVQITSVKNGSPAKMSGLKKGDIIIRVNKTSTLGLTHVQVVRLIVTASPPVTFTIRPGKHHQQYPHDNNEVVPNQNEPGLPTTPLRFCGAENVNVTPPRSPTYPYIYPPSYSPQPQQRSNNCNHGNFESPSHLPLHAINLNQTPPPPYTAKLPSTHKLLAEGVCQQDQTSQPTDLALPAMSGASPLSVLPLPPFPSPLIPPPPSPWLLPTSSPHQSLLLSLPPPPSPLSLLTSDNTTDEVSEEAGDRAIEGCTPDGRQSLLCQIREFHKSSLKSVSLESTPGARLNTEQMRETLQGNYYDFDEPESTVNTGHVGRQRESNNSDLLSLLNQALEDRARVLNTTIDSEDEESDSEWDF